MHFGVGITSNDHPDLAIEERVAQLLERAILIRDNSFDTIGVGHRYSFSPASLDSRGARLKGSQFQPLLLLSYLAGQLGNSISYATTVLVSSGLHPVQLAEDIATLDAFCGGNLRIGIGLGWQPYELEAFGIDSAGRSERFEELVLLSQQLLSSDSVTFTGKYFAVTNACLLARTIQKPYPPIWIGASADGAIKRAARIGDAWIMSSHSTVPELVRQRAIYDEELQRLGRPSPQERPLCRRICIDEDRQVALDRAMPIFTEEYRQRSAVGWFRSKDHERQIQKGDSQWIIGNPQDCIEQIAHIEASLGVNFLEFIMPHELKHEEKTRMLKLIGQEVLPHFK